MGIDALFTNCRKAAAVAAVLNTSVVSMPSIESVTEDPGWKAMICTPAPMTDLSEIGSSMSHSGEMAMPSGLVALFVNSEYSLFPIKAISVGTLPMIAVVRNVTSPKFANHHSPLNHSPMTVLLPKVGSLSRFIRNAAQRMLLTTHCPPEIDGLKARYCHVPSMSSDTRTAFTPSISQPPYRFANIRDRLYGNTLNG